MNHIIKEYYDTHVPRGMEWIEVAKELYQTQFTIKSITKKEKELKDKLQSLSMNVNSIGGGYTYTITARAGGIEYKDIPILKQIDLEPYRKPKTYAWYLKKV